MTTEEDFQKALDACPDDWQTRLVFADWLQERGDVRAEGYRALGVGRFRPDPDSNKTTFNYHNPCTADATTPPSCILPEDWWRAIIGDEDFLYWTDDATRREAEDAAALAFARLPEHRRRELLAGTPAEEATA